LPGFYCKNKGHRPSYVPFTSVNDGVCDYDLCCDGSEEWEGVGGVKCEDKCKEIGKEWRKHDEARQKSIGTAAKKRKELVAQAARMRKEVEDRIRSLSTEIEGAEVKVKNLESEFAEIQKKEKGKVVKSGPGKKGGKISVLIELAKDRMEELRENLIRVREERDGSRSRVRELEDILSTFKEEYNPNFNDEGVKRAVRAWEDYAARDKGPDSEPALDRDVEDMTKSDKDNGLDWEEYEGGEEGSDTDVREYLLPCLVREQLLTPPSVCL
jgi:protein kinase C substrate 80K-H